MLGFCVIYVHRFAINYILPIGFFIALLLLLLTGLVARSYYNKICVYILSLICSITIYLLATFSSSDVLVLANGIDGEKPWSGYIGWILLIGSFLIPFSTTLLPAKWFIKVLPMPLWESGDKDIDFMLSLVNITDVQLEKAFNSGKITANKKDDGTPVTEFDRNIEKFICDAIKKKYPHDLILGEEFGQSDDDNSSQKPENAINNYRRWIIDPIDGTKNFVRGVPIFATLIALEETANGITKPTKSVVSAPLLKRRWWGKVSIDEINSSQNFAYTSFDNYQPKKIWTSSISDISGATFAISSRSGWVNSSLLNWFDGLCKKVARVRGFGDFYSYMLLAEGSVDICAEPDLELYDIAALTPIIEGAGGKITDINGEAWVTPNGIKSTFAHNGNFSDNSATSDNF